MAISGDIVVIGDVYDDEWGINCGSGYVYTNISWKWIYNDKMFLRMVQLMTTLGILLQFWGVLLSLVPLPLGQ